MSTRTQGEAVGAGAMASLVRDRGALAGGPVGGCGARPHTLHGRRGGQRDRQQRSAWDPQKMGCAVHTTVCVQVTQHRPGTAAVSLALVVVMDMYTFWVTLVAFEKPNSKYI